MGSGKAKKSTSKKSDQATKDALAVTEANIARIEAEERGEAPTGDSKPKGGKRGAKPKPAAGKPAKIAAAKPTKTDGKMSGLDAAAKVLADSGKPMKAKAIVEAMVSKGLWTSDGKTPHATIYSAMIREIAEKGKDARFKKVARGEFVANK